MNSLDEAASKVRLYVYHASQCDPKKCTALKMLRLGLAKRLDRVSSIPRRSIVLDPYSNRVLTKTDCDYLVSHGLVAIDCSWENAEELFTYKIRGERRRLPDMVPANPVNYGMRSKLSTVEAFAGALVTCGYLSQAREILGKFKWGQNFLRLNNIESVTSNEV